MKALRYFEKACNSNHPASCYNLAVMYKKGDDGVPADEKLFIEFKAKAEEVVKHSGSYKSLRTA